MEYVIPFLNLAEPATEGVARKTVHYYNYPLCNQPNLSIFRFALAYLQIYETSLHY